MNRKVTIEADSTFKFLQVFNGILELTDKELLILSKLIDIGDTNLCSPTSKKSVADDLGIKDPNTLNNYVKRLKDKGAIMKGKSGYKLSRLIQPSPNVTIEIVRRPG